MKDVIARIFGLEANGMQDGLTVFAAVLSAVLAAAAIAVIAVLAAKGRLRVIKTTARLWNRTKLLFQTAFAVLTNSFMIGWLKGGIYSGKLKYICTPGLNCYSCPGAWGACPIGAIQAILNEFDPSSVKYDSGTGQFSMTPRYRFAFYAVGFIMAAGAVCGRLVCGLLCPFGWVQDLLFRIPIPKLRLPRSYDAISRMKRPRLAKAALAADRALRYVKYLVLAVLVVLIPLLSVSEPVFCKYVCPSGMLMGGVPLLASSHALASQAGGVTALKLAVLAAVIVLSVFIYRPFCRYIYPLGAFYALFNPVSLMRYGVDDSACGRCSGCSACASACPMGVDPVKTPNSPECIRCGVCASVCPNKAIHPGFKTKTPEGMAIRTRRRK